MTGVGELVERVLARAGDLSADQLDELGRIWNRPPEPDRPVDVYFIFSPATGHIKIGMSTDVPGRLRALQTAASEDLELLAVMPGAGRQAETDLHRRFGHLRVRGEWFRQGADLWRMIEGLGIITESDRT